ncbi:hypothetical protein E0K89_001645 [Aquicoccus sp. SCR17]|nr:hypothetical protein [Carideicomes alvinocaridis]
MQDQPENGAEPANIRFLRRLVTVLTAVMIAGLLAIFALLVIRFSSAPDLPLPDSIALPDGTEATAFTQGRDWYAVVTADDRILIYDRATGSLRQELQVTPD